MATPIIEVEVSDQPDTGLKRKVAVMEVRITNEIVRLRAILRHYVNVNGSYGAYIPRFDTYMERDTQNSWVNTNTGQYVAPADLHAIPLEFPTGSNPVAEMDILKAQPEWAGISALLASTAIRMDNRGGLEE